MSTMVPSSSSSSSSASDPPSITLLTLPAPLLNHVCCFLSPNNLLVTLAHYSKTARALLTPAHFSSHFLELDGHELYHLVRLSASSNSLTLRPFYAHVLSECRLSVDVSSPDVSMQHLFNSLDHIPLCGSLSVRGLGARGDLLRELPDLQLYNLLHHATTLVCTDLAVFEFERCRAARVPLDNGQPLDDLTANLRPKRKRHSSLSPTARSKQFEWADIRLPKVTRLRLDLHGEPNYIGGAAFLTAHSQLLHLDVSTMFVTVAELTAIFAVAKVLPSLNSFTLRERTPDEGRSEHNLSALLTALATTVVGENGGVRPMKRLHFDLPSSYGVFAETAVMPNLTHLQVDGARPGWLEEWTGLGTGFQHLQQLIVLADFDHPVDGAAVPASTDMLSFLRPMIDRPLELLRIDAGERVTFSAASLSVLLQLSHLRELCLSTGDQQDADSYMDFTHDAFLTSCAAGSLKHLRVLSLEAVRLSAASIIAIASSAPKLRKFDVDYVVLECHPAVVCAILAGYCHHIEHISVDDERCPGWREVQAADVNGAYQSAVAVAGRGSGYRPFTQLCYLHVMMCWCTTPSVWHAMLSLMRHAAHLRTVYHLTSNDPLAIAALSYLPSLQALGADCLWPALLVECMEKRDEQTGKYRYVVCQQLKGERRFLCPRNSTLQLLNGAMRSAKGHESVLLWPRSDFFTAFRASLSADHQAALQRWAHGSFHADDGQLTAVETPLEPRTETCPNDRACHCPHPHQLHCLHGSEGKHAEQAGEENMADVESAVSDEDDEKQPADGELPSVQTTQAIALLGTLSP